MIPESDTKISPPAVAPASQINLPIQIPDRLKPLAGETFSEIMTRVFSFIASDDADMIKSLTGLFSGLSSVNFDVPQWVKLASRKGFETNGLEFFLDLKADADPTLILGVLGKVTRLIEFISESPRPVDCAISEDQMAMITPLADQLKQFASKASPEQSASFFNERNEGQKNIEKLSQLSVRSKIYVLMAVEWCEIERLKSEGKIKSTNDLHKWLVENRTTRIVIPFQTDSRDVRKVCEAIGLDFENKWTKPQ